jgi:hypothetical protein
LNAAARPSTTNLRGKLPLRAPISPGYPRFANEREKQVAATGCTVLRPLLSGLAHSSFHQLGLIGTFCTQNRLVREAVVAFDLSSGWVHDSESFKISMKSYQNCVSKLQQAGTYEQPDFALVAIMFLGLVEVLYAVEDCFIGRNPCLTLTQGLHLGEFADGALAHFEMCRKLLLSRLPQVMSSGDGDLINLYRMAAECVLYSFAALSSSSASISENSADWHFDPLFPVDNISTSPFLGGLQEIYFVMLRINMLRINVLLHQTPRRDQTGLNRFGITQAVEELWQRLIRLETQVPCIYQQYGSDLPMAHLYRVKHLVTIHALRIHLIKISRLSAAPADADVQRYLQKAITLLRHQDIREPGNIALRWPLTILACAAEGEGDFEFIVAKMKDMERVVGRTNQRMLSSAYTILREYRVKTGKDFRTGADGGRPVHTGLDFLLEPRNLSVWA